MKKYLLAIAVLCLWATPQAHAASFAVDQNGVHTAWTTGDSMTSTFASAPAKGDLVVVGINFYNASNCGTLSSVKDGNGNIFTVTTATTTNAAGSGCSRVAYELSAPSNASTKITATFTTAPKSGSDIWADDFATSGGTVSLDSSSTGKGTGTAVNTPTINISSSGDLLYGIASIANEITSANSPWTGNHAGVAADGNYAEYDLSASTSTAIGFTQNSSGAWNGSGVSFKTTSGTSTPPSVAWVSPSKNAVVSTTIAIVASSTGNGASIASVAFYEGSYGATIASSSLLGSTSTASGTLYTIPWNTTSIANGSTTLWVLSTDTSNNTSTASTTVNIENIPAINLFSASPSSSITLGSPSTISWNTAKASSVTISGNNLALSTSTASGTISFTPNATGNLIYTLQANNVNGTSTATTSITVIAGSTPSISSFSASPAIVASAGTSTLSWNVSNASSVAITATGFSLSTSTLTGSTTVSSTSTLTYTLIATNQNGTSTAATSVTVDASTPTPPTGLAANPISSSQINLSWTSSTDAGGSGIAWYNIFQCAGSCTPTTLIATSSGTSYSNSGLIASTTYTFAVSATNGVGTVSATSSNVSATTGSGSVASGTPTLVQHVATGMEQNPMGTLTIPLPNSAGAGNALILGVQFRSGGSVSSVTDNEGTNIWTAGPSVTNGTYGQTMRLYYALDVAAGTQDIIVNFTGNPTDVQAVVSEFYNVAQASAIDGSSSSTSSKTAGSFTTSASGDLIYEWGADLSDSFDEGGAFNGTSITPGSGFTLLSADLQVGSADQYEVQSGAGAIDPAFTTSGSATWGSLALALKSASAGTPPPAGIRIVHVQDTLLSSSNNQGRPTPIVIQFPSTGNLLVGEFDGGTNLISGVTDNAGNTWVSASSTTGYGDTSAQILYAGNASTSPTLSGITATLNGTPTDDDTFDLYDISGAAVSQTDDAVSAYGDQDVQGNLTTASVTPLVAGSLAMDVTSIDLQTINGVVGSGYMLDSVVNSKDDNNSNGTGPSTLDEDNGYAHIYEATTSPATFVYTYATTTAGGGGVSDWSSVAAAFAAAAPSSPVISSFSAAPAIVASAGTSTLSWSVNNASSVAVTAPGFFFSTSTLGASITVNPTSTTTYTLTATNANGTSTAGTTVTVDTSTPTTPVSLVASTTSGSGINLSWASSTDAGGSGIAWYNIFRCTGSCNPNTLIATSSGVSYSDTNLTASTTYTYAVSATNGVGTISATSSDASTTTEAASLLPVVSFFSASPGEMFAGSSSVLSWNVSNASSVAITPGSFSTSTLVASTTVSPTSTTLYTLTAANANGTSTATTSVTINSVPPISYIQSIWCQDGGTTGASKTCSITPTTGDAIVAFCYDGVTNDTYTFSDSQGNSYSVDGSADRAGISVAMAHTLNVAGRSDTVTCSTATAGHMNLMLAEYAGITGTDVKATSTGTSANPAGGSITTTQSNDLVITAFGDDNNASDVLAAGSGFTLRQGSGSGTSVFVGSLEDEIESTVGTYPGNFTYSDTSGSWAAVEVGLKG